MTRARASNPWWQHRLVRRGLVAVAIAALLAGWLFLNLRGIYFRDALAYWRPDLGDPYGTGQVGVQSTYLYSPAFAQLMAIPGLLPWAAFAALWSAVNLLALIWMAGPMLAAVLFMLPGSPVVDEISTGNIHLLLAAAIVLAFRSRDAWAGAWALPLLTKVTPGIGVLWYAGARQWRRLAIALGVTAAIAALSFVAAPALWVDWIETLRRSSGVPVPGEIGVIPGPLWLRTLTGAIVAVAGGALGWRWMAPIAATLALPVPWSSGLSVLVACIPLSREWWRPALDRLLARSRASPLHAAVSQPDRS